MAHNNLVQSLERGITILNLVARSSAGMTLSELAEELDVQRPTAFNLARTLVAHRYLNKTARPVRFLLGPAALEIADLWRHRAVIQQFEKLVKSLANELDATVAVAESLGGEVIAAHLVEKDRPGVVQHPGSRRLTPYVHVSTLCMMAFWPTEDAAAYRTRYPFAEYGAGVWGNESRLHKFLAEARNRGYVVWDGPNARFLVGVPIFAKNGSLLAAVGVSIEGSLVSTKMEKARVTRKVTRAVGKIGSAG